MTPKKPHTPGPAPSGADAPANASAPSGSAGDPRTDAELIAAVMAGDRAAFEPLVLRHQNAIYGYLYRLLGRDVEAARDLTQAAFLKAYEHLARVDPARPFRTWLYRVAHNEAVSTLRHAGVMGEVALEEPTERTLADEAPSPEAEEGDAEERRAVQAALARMTERERAVLTLYYFEDKSYQEIGAILEAPPNTVATWLRRAKARLAEMLEGLHGEGD